MKRSRPWMLGSWQMILATFIVVVFVVTAIGAPLLAPAGLNETVGDVWEAMSVQHPFGTDSLGRDILSRMIFGARVTLVVAGTATVLSFFIGVTLGFLASSLGALADQMLSRLNDLVMSVPTLIFALVILATVPVNLVTLILVMALLDATRVFRLARALSADIWVMDYIEVARLRGDSILHIITFEMLPNAVAPLVAEFALRFGFAVLFLSALSFLGLGVQPPDADWGSLVRENRDGIIFGVPAALIPGLAIGVLSIAVNTIADGIIDRSARTGGKAGNGH